MSESEKPKRKFWQFHLSTAVALVIVAGGVAGANLTNSKPRRLSLGIQKQYGWPLVAHETNDLSILQPDCSLSSDECFKKFALEWSKSESRWNRIAAFIDSLIAIGILVAVAFCSEFLIRRREARKT